MIKHIQIQVLPKEAKDLTKSFDKLGNESTDVSKDLKKTERSSNKTSKGLKALKVAGTAAAGAIAGIATVAVGTIATIGALGAAYIRAQKAAFDFSREVVDNVNAEDITVNYGSESTHRSEIFELGKKRKKIKQPSQRILTELIKRLSFELITGLSTCRANYSSMNSSLL